jgi:hypothetical protein
MARVSRATRADGSEPSRASGRVGSPALAAIERTWSAIRDQHPDIPAVVAMIGTGGFERGHLALMTASKWSNTGGRRALPELELAVEALEQRPEDLLQTLLHTAAHALGTARGMTTTSRQGRYHNGRFADLAAEVGLTVAHGSETGWSSTALAVGTNVRYATELRELRDLTRLLRTRLGAPRSAAVGRSRSNNGTSAGCSCSPPRLMRMATSVLEQGSVSCGICRQPFVPRQPSAV